jgi:hypothetical protein
MKKRIVTVLIAAGVLAVAAAAVTAGRTGTPATADRALVVARGEYLVKIMGCNDCHTPLKMGPQGPEPDLARFLSGHPEQVGAMPAVPPRGGWLWSGAATNTAFTGPWGVSYAANLTPDQNTGLGIWTEEMFMKAIRTGRHMGTSREILPPMPWPAFRNATDDDLRALYAYLRSIKPVTNHVPDVQPPPQTTD